MLLMKYPQIDIIGLLLAVPALIAGIYPILSDVRDT